MAAFVIQLLECYCNDAACCYLCRSLTSGRFVQYATTALTISTAKNFRPEFLNTKITTCNLCLIAHWPGFIHKSRHHPGTIGSHAAIGIHPHIHNSDNPRTNPDIIQVDTSPHGVEIPTPPADFLTGHSSYVEPAPPREDIRSHPRSRGRSTYLKLPSTGEENRAFSGRHHPVW